MVAVAIHSWKGGTGKTNIAVNWAVLLAQRGNNVAVLDFDFNCPSLCTLFNRTTQIGQGEVNTINDFIDEQCTASDFLVDLSNELKLNGTLLAGFANPSASSIRALAESIRFHGQI